MKLHVKANFSLYAAAITFGVISLKITIKKVTIRVEANKTSSSELNSWIDITVTIEAAAALEKLLHIKITLKSLSVCLINLLANRADFIPFFSRY